MPSSEMCNKYCGCKISNVSISSSSLKALMDISTKDVVNRLTDYYKVLVSVERGKIIKGN